MGHIKSLLGLLLLCAVATALPLDSQPNIVLIVADDLGWNDIGWHNPDIYSPVLDQLASEGVLLENFYGASVCSPSRAQIMTGRMAYDVGIQGVVQINSPSGLPLEMPTMANVLQDVGYSTHIVGKWHLGMFQPEYLPKHRGFDSFYGILAGAQDYYSHEKCVTYSDVGSVCGYDLRDNDDIVPGNTEYTTSLFTRKAVEVIENQDPSKPMFLYLPFTAPHDPLQVPQQYMDLYSGFDSDTYHTYAAMISCLDEGIGNITDALKNAGLYDNTLIVFMSDNGGVSNIGSNTPLRGGKGELWEGGIRVVAMAHGVGIENPGSVSNAIISNTDLFPTFMYLAGNDAVIDGIYGVNVWDSISQGVNVREQAILGIDDASRNTDRNPDLFYPHGAIRSGDFKLVTTHLLDYTVNDDGTVSFPDTFQYWLFNLADDIGEENDVSADNPDLVQDLLQALVEADMNRPGLLTDCVDPDSNPQLHDMKWDTWMDSGEPNLPGGC